MGNWVTIKGQPVFIGGPGSGGGGSAPSNVSNDDEDMKAKRFLDTSGGACAAKDEIVTDISELSGESYEDVNDFVAQWAKSSNDNDMRSLAIQRDAAAEFGLPMSEFTQSRIDSIQAARRRMEDMISGKIESMEYVRPETVLENPALSELLPSDQQRKILSAMYDNTQTKLAEAGFASGDKIRMYRGVGMIGSGSYGIGEAVNLIDDNPLSSWSISASVAKAFANRRDGGVVFAMDVPIEMIIGSARSGFGCLDEQEMVLLGFPSVAVVMYKR